MNASAPLVGIGMPICNEERHLPEALDSILAQAYPDFELLICDNASQDRTPKICLEYAARDPRIRYYRNETNVGAIENFNRVFRLSRGKYFMWAAGHDLWARTFIGRCMERLEDEGSAVLCYPRAQFIREDGRPIPAAEIFVDTRRLGTLSRFNVVAWDLLTCYSIYGVIRRDALQSCRPARIVLSPDVVLLSELAIQGAFISLDEVLFYPRDNWGDLARNTRQERVGRMFRMMAGSETARPPRFPFVHRSWEFALGARHAQVPFWTKCALVSSAVFCCFLVLYRHLPSFLRLPLRRAARARLGVSQ